MKRKNDVALQVTGLRQFSLVFNRILNEGIQFYINLWKFGSLVQVNKLEAEKAKKKAKKAKREMEAALEKSQSDVATATKQRNLAIMDLAEEKELEKEEAVRQEKQIAALMVRKPQILTVYS